ncbi:uncharacterized protein LOC123537214 [Mercenaria mercenaria]|uniref:uncharacterized protein LOC123537214 n=1 Tax=Mercenaria mercenaria TaxID=6596 RepID=UPI00234F0454|nr:uncharacterized protein LOC123537214 [Mercenaria mercenaria]
MEDLKKLKESKEYRNYKGVQAATCVVGASLENYTVQCLDSVHQKISNKLGPLLPCTKQCSQQIPDHNKWCRSCISWKNELKTFFKQKMLKDQPKWRNMESWKWPTSSLNIAEVFLPVNWSQSAINLKDTSTQIYIWKRCSEVPSSMGKSLESIKNIRNNLAHNTNLKIDDNDTRDYFQKLNTCVNQANIKSVIQNHPKLLNDIKYLEKHSMDRNIERALKKINARLKRIEGRNNSSGQDCNISDWKLIIFVTIIAVIAAVSTGLVYMREADNFGSSLKQKHKNEGCLTEDSHRLFPESIRVFKYLPDSSSFVGRQWLFHILQNMTIKNSTKHGVMMLAEMGYGKSAIAANIICSTSTDTSYSLRERLIAYHVCRFDSEITKKPHIFIRRIAAMLHSHIAGFSELVELSYTACIRHFDERECEEDPYGCFDQCIRFPLIDMYFANNVSKIIIIDGLDECEDTLNNENKLAELLTNRINTFPRWIKLLISCRDVPACRKFQSTLEILRLNSNQPENRRDIEQFLRNNRKSQSEEYVFDISNTNFLLATIFQSEQLLSTVNYTVDALFEQQFRRYFKNYIRPTKTILSILLSSFKDFTYWDIWYIVGNTTEIEYDTYEYIMGSLEQFFQHVDGKIHLFHYSLESWLFNSNNRKFGIHSSDGHHLLATYHWLMHIRFSLCIDVVEFVIHASLSPKFQHDLQQIDNEIKNKLTDADCQNKEHPLHRLAKRFDNAMATEHLLKYFPKVDILDEYNRTASFIAATFGHVETLRTLLKYGANVTYRTESFYNIINLDKAVQIAFELQHWDYGLLDIAAQNGHLSVVKYLMDNSNVLSYPLERKNGLNLLPVYLACKLGHTQIVRYLTDYNINMTDNVCLYFASERGNYELVSYLLESGMRDECRPCSSQLNWVPEGKSRIQGEKIVTDLKKEYRGYYVLFDDWQYLTCETALHVAVRLNKIKISQLLTHYTNNAINCKDRGGRTPFLTAVQFDRRKIAEDFINKDYFGENIRCTEARKIKDIAQLNEKERDEIDLYSCCLNCSILHVAAQFGRIWFVDHLYNSNVSIDWNIKDGIGCQPVHTAACRGQTEFISFLINRHITNFDTECRNGLTPLQYAANCRSLEAVKFILQHTHNPSKSILTRVAFAALDSSVQDTFANNSEESELDVRRIVTTLLKIHKDFEIVDGNKRNILHHAITNGHFHVVLYMFQKNPRTSERLMRRSDTMNETPLQRAVSHKKKTSHTVVVFNFDNLDQEFTIDLCKHYLSPVELSIILALDFSESLLPRQQMDEFLVQLLEKNYVSVVAVYVKFINKHIVRDQDFVSKILPADSTELLTIEILMLKIYYSKEFFDDIVDCFYNCDAILYRCLYHKIALTDLQLTPLINRYLNKTVSLLEYFLPFGLHNLAMLSSCQDREGYTVLERAIQGENENLVKHLLDIGVESKRPITELLQMTVTPSKKKYYVLTKLNENGVLLAELIERNVSYSKWSRSVEKGYSNTYELFVRFIRSGYNVTVFGLKTEHMDRIASAIIDKYHKSIKPASLCSKFARKFSFVHIAALQGMENTLRKIWHYFGDDVITCPNIHLISPLYIASRLTPGLNLASVKEFQNYFKVTAFVEKQILFQTYTRFKLKKHGEKVLCIFDYSWNIPRNMYRILKSYICQKRLKKYLQLGSYSMEESSKFIYNMYSYLNNLKMSTSLCQKRHRNSGIRTQEGIDKVFRRVTRRMDVNLHFMLDKFIIVINLVKSYRASVITLMEYKDDIDKYPSERECPKFKRDMMNERQTWGILRNEYRYNVWMLKLYFITEITHMASRIPQFHFPQTNVLNVLSKESAYLRFNRAFSYIKIIENLSVFEDDFVLYLQTTTKAEIWHWIELTDHLVKYARWSREALSVEYQYKMIQNKV